MHWLIHLISPPIIMSGWFYFISITWVNHFPLKVAFDIAQFLGFSTFRITWLINMLVTMLGASVLSWIASVLTLKVLYFFVCLMLKKPVHRIR